MFFRVFVQGLLAVSLLQVFPNDGAVLERAASLPVAPIGSAFFPALVVASAAQSLPISVDRLPKKVDPESVGIVTTAQSVLVLDRATHFSLYKKNAEAIRPMGSITKLMTALVFLEENPHLDAQTSILPEDYREGGRLYLNMQDPLTVQDVLHASLVGSDNTATMTLVRLSIKSEEEFVARMNEKAKELQMTHTTFKDPTGLSSKNVSTVYDITFLLDAALAIPEIQSTVSLPQVTVTQDSGFEVTIPSTDDLLESFLNELPYKMLGGKTGYLPEAGYCMGVGVGYEGEGEVLIVLLGSESKTTRIQEMKGLAEWAFRVYDWP